jgi:signal transduction histidine kinase
VAGDRLLLKQVLVNLLDNALKYSRRQDPTEIEIGFSGIEEGMAILFIKDNGVGFDPALIHKLFEVFQRLHGDDEFEGTGVGLANVRRIIARHGGRTWAKSSVGKGATFFFTLRPAPAGSPGERG